MEQEIENVEETKFESANDDSVIKVDLNKPIEEENANTEQSTDEVSVRDESETSEEVRKENVEATVEESTGEEKPEEIQDEQPVIEEITNEEVEEVEDKVEEVAEQVEEAVAKAKETGEPLPENIQKLIDFMNETGGDVEDYVRLNQDYSKLDNTALLREYYKKTKPHLDSEEVDFLMKENFSYDEEVDEENDIRKKKIALKEQVAEAKAYLDGQKSKYYDEIKAGSKLTPEQQKAWDFFNRYNKESEETKLKFEKEKSNFLKKTDNVFNNKFKGFEYNVGEKKFRFNVKDANKVKESQQDISTFVKRFLNKDGMMEDAAGYHKSLFTAMNADTIAKHFYDQGRADALKDSISKSKNVNMDPRQTQGTIDAGGIKVRVLGDNSSDFKFKINKK
tara:strand:+ start:444 stop:1622 length:1179 start_codon:yes stop_codon:yes gene_type:complete